ncbi:amino acid permease [Streptomyces sp. NPDC055912]|uniref:amino acid permease n=1 Tax=Streptomyces sp. NPDC055912 TaxID=3345660 RepID=UPI0035DF222C
MQLVRPETEFDAPDIAGQTMSVQVGGQVFADWTSLAGIVADFGSGLAVQLSSSRLLHTMGRYEVLPKLFFGALNARTGPRRTACCSPEPCVPTGLGLALETATSFINFGAFLAFTAVNICVVVHCARNRGAGRGTVLGHVVTPVLGACVTLYLMTSSAGERSSSAAAGSPPLSRTSSGSPGAQSADSSHPEPVLAVRVRRVSPSPPTYGRR